MADGEVEIGGSIEHRIAAQDDECLDRARLHRGDERGQRAHARKRRVLRLVVADRLAGVAEMRVQRAHRGVDTRGLALSGDDQPLAAVRQKILRNGVDPAPIDTGDIRSRLAGGPGRTEARRERREKRRDLPALETEPMIGHGPRQRVHPFNGVEPVHRATGGSRAAVRPRTRARDGSSPDR